MTGFIELVWESDRKQTWLSTQKIQTNVLFEPNHPSTYFEVSWLMPSVCIKGISLRFYASGHKKIITPATTVGRR